jgi:ankyrin repeat protein
MKAILLIAPALFTGFYLGMQLTAKDEVAPFVTVREEVGEIFGSNQHYKTEKCLPDYILASLPGLKGDDFSDSGIVYETVQQRVVDDIEKNMKSSYLHFLAGTGELVKNKKILEKYRKNINKADPFGSTPVFKTVFNGDLDALKLLHENGANLFAVRNNGEDLLSASLRSGNPDITSYLLSNGFSFDDGEKYILTALANAGTNRGFLKEILEKSDFSNASQQSKIPISTISMVILKDNTGLALEYILKNNIILNVPTDGYTPIQAAVMNKTVSVSDIEKLIKLYPDVNEGGIAKSSPLCYAVTANRYDVAEMLLKNGAAMQTSDYDIYQTLNNSGLSAVEKEKYTELLRKYENR